MLLSLSVRYDEKFRKTLVETVPGIDPVLKVFLNEEGNALDEAGKSISKATQKVSEMSSTVTGYFGGGATKEPEPKVKHSPVSTVSTKRNRVFSSIRFKAYFNLVIIYFSCRSSINTG